MLEIKTAASFALLAIPIFYIFKLIIVYFLDPLNLRKYPAPSLLAATTPLWLVKETWLQRRSRSVHQQHERLGDVIRVGPNQILFNIPEAIPDIYGHLAARKIVKDVFYDKVAADFHDIVNTRDHEDHAQRRKYLSNSFALKTVVDMEPVIRNNFQRLLDRIDKVVLAGAEVGAPKEDSIFDIRKW